MLGQRWTSIRFVDENIGIISKKSKFIHVKTKRISQKMSGIEFKLTIIGSETREWYERIACPIPKHILSLSNGHFLNNIIVVYILAKNPTFLHDLRAKKYPNGFSDPFTKKRKERKILLMGRPPLWVGSWENKI